MTTGSVSNAGIFSRQNIVLAGLPCLLLLGGLTARRNRRWLLAFLVFFAVLSVNACGGGASGSPNPPPNPNQTPASTYTIVVTAADGTAANRTVTITLSVSSPQGLRPNVCSSFSLVARLALGGRGRFGLPLTSMEAETAYDMRSHLSHGGATGKQESYPRLRKSSTKN